MSRERFVEVVRDAILSLPQDLKAVLRIVEDPEIDDESRISAAGALLHVLSSANASPGLRGLLAYVDDVLVLRLALERILARSPEAMERHRQESPELLGPLADQLTVSRGYLGELTTVLDKAVDGLPKLSHQGRTPDECVRDTEGSNWLYETVHEALVNEFDFDEEQVARAAKSIDQVLSQMRLRA
jgi:uncharacterized membrane protein YkvA (DUF1232 family)